MINLGEPSDEVNETSVDDSCEALLSLTQTTVESHVQPSGHESPFYNQLKNGQFRDTLQAVQNNPHYLQQMEDQVPVTYLAPFFIFLLKKNLTTLAQILWQNNPVFTTYFYGRAIQLEGQTEQLSLSDYIANFKVVLSSQYSALIQSVWEESNRNFTDYFSGHPIEIQTTDNQLQQLTDSELIDHFKMALSARNESVIMAIWADANSPLQQAIKKLDDQALSKLMEKVLCSLSGGTRGFVELFLDSISDVNLLENSLSQKKALPASYYRKKQIDALEKRLNTLKTPPLSFRVNNQFLELVEQSKALLKKRKGRNINELWENNPVLVSYFSGQLTPIDGMNAQGQAEIRVLQLSLAEFQLNFRLALTSQCPSIIQSMWAGNPLFRAYFSGQPIALQIINDQGELVSEIRQLEASDLIINFRKALSSRNQDIMGAMWGEANSPLQEATKGLNDYDLLELVENVLVSSTMGSSAFIHRFLGSIIKIDVLMACLNNKMTAPPSKFKQNQIAALQNRIYVLNCSSNPYRMYPGKHPRDPGTEQEDHPVKRASGSSL